MPSSVKLHGWLITSQFRCEFWLGNKIMKDNYKCEECGKLFEGDYNRFSVWVRCTCGGRAFTTSNTELFTKGVTSFDYYTPGGKKHTISNAHYKDIKSRRFTKNGEVLRG